MQTRDRGAAGVETALAVTSLLLVAFFLIGGLRVIGTNGDVVAAAHAGARAAAAERNPTAAAAAARSVVGQSLADRGVACQSMSVQASGDLTPGSLVTVDVSCTVSLADVVLAGFPGARTVAATGVEQVDVIRGAPDG